MNSRVTRIFCIGKNYAEHVAELAHLGHVRADDTASAQQGVREPVHRAGPAPTSLRSGTVAPPDGDCVVFMKPPSSVVAIGSDIELPRGRGSIHHEAELVVQATGGGSDIPVDDAMHWVAGITLGLDLTLRELQTALKKAGKPWELAKAFDGAAPMGEFRPYLEQDLQDIAFSCTVNGTLRQQGHTRDMLFPVARQIHIISQTWALQPGDVIYTGTPAGVGPLVPGDDVVLESPQIGRFSWHCR